MYKISWLLYNCAIVNLLFQFSLFCLLFLSDKTTMAQKQKIFLPSLLAFFNFHSSTLIGDLAVGELVAPGFFTKIVLL